MAQLSQTLVFTCTLGRREKRVSGNLWFASNAFTSVSQWKRVDFGLQGATAKAVYKDFYYELKSCSYFLLLTMKPKSN